MEIVITRSARRKRTVSARLVGNKLLVRAPLSMSEKKLSEIIRNLQKRIERRALKNDLDRKENLADVCRRLNEKYFGGTLRVEAIEYSTDQLKRFGSCNPRARTIRISYRLAEMPRWVRDYVIIHEMAHILEPGHGPAFWKLVSRYKLAERARGYLIAKSFEDTDESDVEPAGTGEPPTEPPL